MNIAINLVNIFFEIGSLKKVIRSSKKGNSSSISEHNYRVTMIGYFLAVEASANENEVIKMCLIHDLPETRVGDLDLVQKRYLKANEKQVIKEMVEKLKLGDEIKLLFDQYISQKSLEAKLCHDADILEELLTEKEQYDAGETRAKGWMEFTYKRLKTKIGKEVGKTVMVEDSNNWWYQLVK